MKLGKVLTMMVFLACLLMFCGTALASPSASVLYNEIDLENGSYQYDFIFNNTSTQGESLYKVFFYFDQLSMTTGMPLPTGWVGTVWNGPVTNTFINTMALNQNYYIAPDSSMGGFSFTINYQLGESDFVAEFKSPDGKKFAYGGTTAPIVPEPVSSTLFIIGGVALGVRTYLKRKK
ncbi:MAG: hypothetical protein HZA16_08980 [Nitrospirae bacterium]|nr:hypothetical protein [Nitrospirota bacterium]